MAKSSTKYQLLQDDFRHATEQLKLYRKEIECLKTVISNSKRENRRLKKEIEQADTVYIVMREEDDGTTRPYRSYKTCERASEAANSLTKIYAEEEDDINGGCRFYVESLYLEG